MKRYWFTFEHLPTPTPLNLGCGVTAMDLNDAQQLVAGKIFPEGPMPHIVSVQENIAISELDSRHVVPNMGTITQRGIWFPLGYS